MAENTRRTKDTVLKRSRRTKREKRRRGEDGGCFQEYLRLHGLLMSSPWGATPPRPPISPPVSLFPLLSPNPPSICPPLCVFIHLISSSLSLCLPLPSSLEPLYPSILHFSTFKLPILPTAASWVHLFSTCFSLFNLIIFTPTSSIHSTLIFSSPLFNTSLHLIVMPSSLFSPSYCFHFESTPFPLSLDYISVFFCAFFHLSLNRETGQI